MSPVKPLMKPMIVGETASPRAWMMRMFRAKALARIDGCVTLARIVLVGPVLKNKQKQARKMKIQAAGNGVQRAHRIKGKATPIAMADTRKYAPGILALSLSPAMPPRMVAPRPD